MQIDLKTGLVSGARFLPSPNCDERPADSEISLLVVHNISLPPGEYGGSWIDDFFCNRLDYDAHPYFAEIRDMKVSSHLLVRRTGELVQYVPFHLRAWHAGQSSFEGRSRCNDFSVGIELEGVDDRPYEAAQYDSLAGIARKLLQAFPGITRGRIVGHSDIAPVRKTDPGPAFDWAGFRDQLREG